MKDSWSSLSEFSALPEDFQATREPDHLPGEEFPVPGPAAAAEEMRELPPEEVLPGLYPYTKREKKGKKRAGRWFLLAGLLFLFLTTGVLGGLPGEGASAEPAPALPQENGSEPGPGPAEPTPAPEPGGQETRTYTVPSCDIILVGMASEMMGTLSFRDTEDLTAIQYELRDPELDKTVETRAIQPEELEEGVYDLGLFSSEPLYQASQDYYDAQDSFPMETEVRVTMTYDTADGPAEAVVTQRSKAEETFWWLQYDGPAAQGEWAHPQNFVLTVYGETPQTVVLDQPELVKEGADTISIHLEVDGVPVTGVDLRAQTEKETWTTAKGETRTQYTTTALLPYAFASGSHAYEIQVTQYLESYQQVYTAVQQGRYPQKQAG